MMGRIYDRSNVNQMFFGCRFSRVSQFRVILRRDAGFFGKTATRMNNFRLIILSFGRSTLKFAEI
ncbi:hypothetical protein [Floridanema evergladense]|uniref:Uncharacterized protein n=1 Tax=Floridaenema evergladense BLCC-F167 TaxID=3153639 RepID=A0ABV4WE66_9CYAN